MRRITKTQETFLDRARIAVEDDLRFHALLAGGSYIHGYFDEHSDLDLIVVVESSEYLDVMASRMEFAEKLGELVGAFTGEHVGEPRLLICLYESPLFHVDLKFVTASDLDKLVESPVVLFSRDRSSTEARLAEAHIAWPNCDPDWFEARAWVWLHYASSKLARGELYEAIGMLSFFREQVLGPMLHRRAGFPQRGVRRVEELDEAGILATTLASHNEDSVKIAIVAAIRSYMDLRADAEPSRTARGMPDALLNYIDGVGDSALH